MLFDVSARAGADVKRNKRRRIIVMRHRRHLTIESGRCIRSLIALTLLSGGGGCYVSVPVPHGHPYKAYATTAPSKVPITIGKTTKSEAKRVLGDPYAHTSDDAVWVYSSLVTKAIGLWLPIIIPVHGGSIQPEKSEYQLFLIFGNNDILTDFEVISDDDVDTGALGTEKAEKRSHLRHLSTWEMKAYEAR